MERSVRPQNTFSRQYLECLCLKTCSAISIYFLFIWNLWTVNFTFYLLSYLFGFPLGHNWDSLRTHSLLNLVMMPIRKWPWKVWIWKKSVLVWRFSFSIDLKVLVQKTHTALERRCFMVLWNIESINRNQQLAALNNNTICRLGQQSANFHASTAAARCSDSLCLSGSPGGPSLSCLESLFRQHMMFICMYVWVHVYHYTLISIYIIHAQIHFHGRECFSSSCWSHVCLLSSPFLTREGRGVEKAGCVCSVPPASFCSRSSHRGNSTISSGSHRVAVLTGSHLQRDSPSMAAWNFLSCFTAISVFLDGLQWLTHSHVCIHIR